MSQIENMEKANCLAKLHILAKGMNERFPAGNEPYQIATRIMEECGEVAAGGLSKRRSSLLPEGIMTNKQLHVYKE